MNRVRREPTVLVVDDEIINVRLLEAILVKEGFRAIKAYNGPDGRKLAAEELPDLILLDLMMPTESGFETCRKLKDDPRTTDIPVIFISALGDVDNKVRGLSIGAVDYITKPFEMAEVLARTRLHIKLSLARSALIEEQSVRLRQYGDAQRAILAKPEDFPDAGFAVLYRPFHEAGGDFYDVIRVSDSIFGYFVADISGHDLGASFITSALKALVAQNSGPMFTPAETMKMINGVMRSILADGQHITASYAQLNRLRSKLAVVNAGHPPTILVDTSGQARRIESRGDILGVFDAVSLEPATTSVATGDRVFLYTDGMIEGYGKRRKSREEGVRDLEAACVRTRTLPLDEAVREVVGELLPADCPPSDDLLLLGVQI